MLRLRGISFVGENRPREAAQAASKLVDLDNAKAGELYDAACVLCLSVKALEAAANNSADKGTEELKEQWIQKALASLKLSVERGWNDFGHMQRDDDLDILRERKEYKNLLPEEN